MSSRVYVRPPTAGELLIEEIGWTENTRDNIALAYAAAIRYDQDTDWGEANRLIIERWSLSALKYIKGKAWTHNATLAAAGLVEQRSSG